MNLSEWMKQEKSLKERLLAVESLCQAILDSSVRAGRGGFLDPGRIEVKSDGTCRVRDGSSSASEPGYRAPEVVGKGASSPRADVFVIGVLAYELVSGQHPFRGGDPDPDARITPLQSLRPELPDDFCDAVSACLERDPEWRAKDVTYLHQLTRKVRDETTSTVILASVSVPSPPDADPTLVPGVTERPSRDEPTVVPRQAPMAEDPTLVPSPAPAAKVRETAEPRPRVTPPATRVAAPPPPSERMLASSEPRSSSPREGPARARRSNAPVFALLGIVAVAAAGGGFLWWRGTFGAKPVDVATTTTGGTPGTEAVPGVPPSPFPSAATRLASAAPATSSVRPSAARGALTATTPPPVRPSTPPSTRVADGPPLSRPPAATPPPAVVTPPPIAVAPATAPLAPTTTVPAAPPPTVPAGSGPPSITTLSPPILRRPANTLIDVHGANLHADFQVQVFRAGVPAPGITVVRQRYVDTSLLQVLLKLEAEVAPGPYQLLVADPQGARSNVKTFEVAK